MDSYTLFGHVVDVAGIMTCQRAHIELQALGVLPEASLENNPPLKQEDAAHINGLQNFRTKTD
jgi:hypothetical protein